MEHSSVPNYCLLKYEILLRSHTCFLCYLLVCFTYQLYLVMRTIVYSCVKVLPKTFINDYIYVASSLGRNESELSFRILVSREHISCSVPAPRFCKAFMSSDIRARKGHQERWSEEYIRGSRERQGMMRSIHKGISLEASMDSRYGSGRSLKCVTSG